jgi:PAS domain S-box-containing protein
MSPVRRPAHPSGIARAEHRTAGARSMPRFADRYDIVRSLKQGNGVSTYLAIDSLTADEVVLKTFDPANVRSGMQARFVHETRVLRELTGVGVCALHDAGQTDSRLYLVQPYVPGVTLETALVDGPLTVIGALGVGMAVANALDLAHAAGVYHRDVKPANVLVDERGPDGSYASVTLIDFGFARSPWLAESIRDELVGTVRYLSPESAGALPSAADERSDLYALGVVLYECLTGRPPFEGPSVGDLLRQHLSTPVPDLRAAGPPVPRALAAVVHRLLRKDPGERYQTAAAVAADLVQIRAGVEAGESEPPLVIGRHDRRLTLTDPAFVGRDAELATLTALATGLRRGRAGLVLLDADSGGGKSRLLSEVATAAAAASVSVVQGQGAAHGGQRPFTVLHGVAEDLVAALADQPARRAELAAGLVDVAPAVVRALPALADLLGAEPDHDTGPEQFGELRGLAGLRRLLGAAGTPDRPVLMILDDCQWADALTVRLLAELFADEAAAPRHLGVIVAFRAEEVAPEHPLRAIAGARTMHLGPLPARSVGLLAESMAGTLPGVALDTVVRLADGNPFMAAAVLRGLAESEVIAPGPDGWTVDPDRVLDVQAARRSAAFLVRRLELLGPAALELLSVGAVLGKQFDVRTALLIADPAPDADAILDEARRRRLLWRSDDGARCTFFHDKIRESLLARMTDDLRRDLHGRAADVLLVADRRAREDLVFDLAYHLDAAGRASDALPFALAAAELARRRYALDVAVTYYEMAAAAVDPADGTTRRRIAEGLGDVLTLQGVYGAAEEQLRTARALVTDPSEAATLDGKLGALAFKQADIATAKSRLEGALGLLGRRVPPPALRLPLLVWELLVQSLHTVVPRLIRRRSPDGRDDDFLAMRLYSRLAYLYWFHSGKVSCAWSHLRGMNLAERYGPSAELGQAWSEHAPVMTMLPWYRRGVRYAQRSLEIRRELGDVWGQGQSQNFTGVALYAASDYAGARRACEEAIRLLRRTGDQWEVNTATWNLALCLLRTGDLTGTVESARKTYESASAIGDQTAAGIALSIWARAADGRVPAELVRAQLAHGADDAQTTAELHLADALVHRADGDLTRAIGCVDRAVRTIRSAGLRQEYIAPVFAWHATLTRELAQATPAHAPRLLRKRVRRAAASSRRARRWARAYRNNAAHALREAALVASLRRRHRRAVRLLQASEQFAIAHGELQELALTRLAQAELDPIGSGTDYADAVAALAALAPVAHPSAAAADQAPAISVLDRFTALLEVGRSIAAAPSATGLESAVREATFALLRPERCYLIPVAELSGARLASQSGDGVDGISYTLLAQAIEEGAPVVALDETPATTDSLVLSGVRSALAAPIFVEGAALSCLYVTHRQVGELFGEEERQLAALITTLAGAAYEHLAGSETRFRSLAQSSSDVTTLVDAEGTVTYQSAAVQTVFGLPAPGLVGRPITDWVHPDDVGTFRTALAAAAGDGPNQRVECRFRHVEGSYRFVETAVTNLLAEPTVGALVLNTRDITDRKLAADQLRVVEERERIARDLHDVVIQRLFAVGLRLDAMSARMSGPEADQVANATDELHHTIRDIRSAIFSLRSDEPSRPLHERLDVVFNRAEQVLGFAPEVTIAGQVDAVRESVHLHLLATVNEALSNTARHSGATAVDVSITVADDALTLVVTDNGRGLRAERQESGLANLRRRAQLAGGTMTTEPGPGGVGLVLTWRVPMTFAESSGEAVHAAGEGTRPRTVSGRRT